MKIYVKTEDKELSIPIPNWIFKSKFMARLFLKNNSVIKNLNENGIDEDLLFDFMKILTSEYKGLKLIEVSSGDEEVEIII